MVAVGSDQPDVDVEADTSDNQAELTLAAGAPVAIDFNPSGPGLVLDWPPSPLYCAYEVYRSDAPYFEPSPATMMTGQNPPPFIDVNGLGVVGTNQFYIVRSLRCDGLPASDSPPIGEFDFGIVPGD